MAVEAAKIIIPVKTNANKTTAELKVLDSQVNKLSGSLKAFAIAGAGVAGAAFLSMAKSAVKAASDAAETRQKFEVTFRSVSKEADKSAKNLAKSFGLSTQASEKLLGNTGDLLSGFGFTGKAALKMSTKVNKLAADLASFSNIEGGTARASQALTSALLGEREQVKQLGIVISEAAVKQKLLEKGQTKLTGNALLQAKAEATLQIAIEQSTNAIGDYQRSYNSFANQLKRVNAATDDFIVAVGTPLKDTLSNSIFLVESLGGKVGELALSLLHLPANYNKVIKGTVDWSASIFDLIPGLSQTIRAMDEMADAMRRQEQEAFNLTTSLNKMQDSYLAFTARILALNKRLWKAVVDNREFAQSKLASMTKVQAADEVLSEEEKAMKLLEIRTQLAASSLALGQSITNAILANQQAEIDAMQRKHDRVKQIADREKQIAEAGSDAERAALAKQFAFEDKIEKKRRQLARNQAIADKIFGIASIGIQTPIAITKALAVGGIPLAVATGIFAAAQLAAIVAAPIPSAQFGGSFVVPPGNQGDSGLVRVNQGEQVDVTPVTDSGGMPDSVNISIDGNTFKGFINDAVNQGFEEGKIIINRRNAVRVA